MILTHSAIHPTLCRFAWGSLCCIVLGSLGCGLRRPADPAPFDCAAIDRAAERFPEECAEGEDAGSGETQDAGRGDAP